MHAGLDKMDEGNSADVADSTNIHVQTYKSVSKLQLIAAKRQLRDDKSKLREKESKLRDKESKLREKKPKLRDEESKLRDEESKRLKEENKLLKKIYNQLIETEKKILLESEGEASYLAFLERLLFLNLVPCCISLRPLPTI